jgi:DNA replication and repair protein RecF
VHIQWIQVSDFRNYRSLSYEPAPNLNILSGPNAQGKSNLLEGLAMLLVGRSPRGARGADMVRWESEGAVVAGEVRRGNAGRVVRRSIGRRDDGTWSVQGQGCGWARAIPFGWQDVAIVGGMPQARRNYLDGFAGKMAPAHLSAVARYRRVLARRNGILQADAEDATLRSQIEPWDQQLAELGVEIIRRRRAAVTALQAEVDRLYPALADGDTVRLEYGSALGEETTVEGFLEAVDGRRAEERRRGQSLVGPHRDDLSLAVDGHDVRNFGSRGQQRLLALTLRLAEVGPVAASIGTEPILLLDDALSELDPGVQDRVLREIEAAGQVFLTTAEGMVPSRTAAWWTVCGGSVTDTMIEAVRGVA